MGNNTAKRVSNFLGTSALTRPLFALGAASVLFGAGPAHAIDASTLPQNPNVVGGKDSFSQSGNTLNINQQTKRTVIDWRSFDIGSKAQVNFNQPGTSSIAVNRVNSSANPTQIQGGLHANGQVWILNPNGVFFGKTARVDAAGIVATTANIDDKAFMAGSNKLQFTGADHGSVENQGSISVGANGLAAFVAPSVRNSGTINATVGRVALAAGTTYTLDLAGDHLVELGLGSVKAVVDNSGKIVNPGGTIALTAKAAGQVVSSVVNVSGTVSASSASTSGGTITLGGDNVTTTSTAQISADAGKNGNGGSITSVANNQGNYAGSFSAKGGSQSGNGGKIETSGKNVTVADGISVDTRAANGMLGDWTVDPLDVTITSGTGGGLTGSTVTAGAIQDALNTTNVTITTDQTGTDNGDLTLASSINASGPGSLTLTGRHLSATGGSTISLAGALTLNVNAVNALADTTSGNWVQDAVSMIGGVTGGSTVHLGAGSYSGGTQIHANKVTLTGDAGAKILSLTNGMDGVEVFGNNVTIQNLEFAGPANQSYLTYAWGGTVTRGIFIENGAQNFTITNNNIHGLRNDILVDGRNTGSITNNTIDNSKSGISVQYTDGTAYDKSLDSSGNPVIVITGNQEGQYGNEWGINYHLNGYWNGVAGDETHPNSNPVVNGIYLANAPTAAWQQGMLDQSAANGGMSIQDQAYKTSNRTSVTVGTTGSDSNQGSPLNNLATIQAGINAVVSGGVVNVLNGTYTIAPGSNYINVTKSLSLIGQSETGVIIDARNGTTYGLRVSGPNSDVTLENFTLYGTTTYGLKAEDTTNLTLANITSRGAGKSEFDLNGIINGTLTNLTADGAPVADATDSTTTSGNGISFTNSQHITLTNSTTRNNAWGGLALYQGTTYGDLQLTDITVNGSNTFHEANGIYAEDQSSVTDIGTIDLSGQGITYVAQGLVAPNDFYTWFRTSKQGAIDAAAAVSSVGYVQAYDGNVGGTGNFYVGISTGGTAMSIQAAINAATSGAEIDVAAGTYTQALNIGKNVDIEGAGAGSTIIQPTALLTTGVGHKYDSNMKTAVYVHDASDVTINGVTIDANNLGANAVVFWNNAAGTISNAVIENPMAFTGLQTGQGLAVDATGTNVTDLTVDNVTFQNWNKNAIDAVTGDGSGTNGGTIDLTVTNSNFIGHGNTGTIAQNGILAWEQGGGTVNLAVDGDSFSGLSFNDPNTATAAGVLVYGSTNGTVTVSNSDFDNSVQEYISTAGGSPNEVDATNGNTFGGVATSTATLDQLYDIVDKITDGTDDSSNGLVRLVAGHVYATAAKDNIQNAVDVASNNDIINIQAGNYEGQVVISGKALALEGAGVGDTTISAPDLLAHSFSANGTQYRAVVSIEGGADVTVTGLTVDGRGVGDANAGLLGIGIYNSNATIDGVTITRVRSGGLTGSLTGAQGGTGVGAFNDSGLHSVTVENSTINDFQKNGIQFVGKGISAVATNNVITGAGSTGVIAQNGIEIYGTLGSISGANISGNTISGIDYSGASNSASDIILINANNALVQGNTITGTGASDTSNGIYVTESTGVNLIGNTIHSTGYGIDVDNGFGVANVTIQNNIVTGNGVGVQVGYDETDTSVVNAYNNDFSGNTFAVELESSSDVANFSGNWWGSTDANTISAMMTGADAALVDFSPFLMSGTDTSAATGFQGNFANLEVTTLGGGDAARIQEGIADVTAGGTVNLDVGNYTLAGELDITKSLTLKGLSETGTIITSNSTGYGINVTADNVSLQNFTYHGPTAVGSTYGIKVTPDTGVASDRLLNFDIENVTIDGGYRTGLDLNGVVGATITSVSVSNIVHGNGIALTDSANVTITGASTSNNAWGGLALYQTNNFYDQQLNNIVVDSTSEFHEANGVYEEDQSASLDMGSLSLAGYNYAAIDKSVANDQYTFFQKTEQGAIDFATDATLNSGHLTLANTYVEGWSGTGLNGQFYVGTGANSSQLLIATAVGAASAGNTINVASGTYAEDVAVGTQLSFNFGDVNVNSLTLGSGAAGSSLNGDLTATGTIASSGAVSLDGDFTAASIALNGATTLTGSTTLDTSAANGDITVASVVGGGKALALKTGTGTSSLGNVANAGSITALGAVTLTGTQYGAGAETFGATTLTGDTTFDVGTGNVVLASVVGGGNDMTVNAGSTSLGNVSNAGAVAVNGAATLSGSAYSGSSFAFGGAVSLTKDTTIGATGAVSLASLSGGGNDLAITGAKTSLGNVANAGALSVSGPATLTGTSYVAGSIGLGATTLTGDTSLNTSGSNGAITVASVDGAHALSIDAGTGSVSLGNVGATSGLTSLSDASATTLTGTTYNAGSFVFDGGVTLTAATTTLSTNGGDITFNGDIFGTADGAQSLTLNAGPGTNSGANGDITLQNAGTSGVRLGDMTVSGNDFTALTVWLAGSYSSTLTGNQVFAADTLHTGGNVNSTVGGNASGHIESDGDVNIAAQGDVSGTINGQNVTLSGDDVNASVTATDTATVTGNTVEGSYSADTVSITANNNVDAAVTATDFTLSAKNGSVDGTWTNLDASGSGVVSVNGQTVVGEANFNPAQLVVEGFVLPAGTIIGPNGQLILPQGVLLGLLSPGGGKPKMILVHTVQDLGQLLAEGYSVIVIDLSGKDKGKPIQLASN